MNRNRAGHNPLTGLTLKLPCELVLEHLLPVIRRRLAQELVGKHGLSQLRAAGILGVSQPAISHYLSSEPKMRDEFRDSFEHIESTVSLLSEGLAKGKLTQAELLRSICALCIQMRSNGPLCEVHSEAAPWLKWHQCSICTSDLVAVRRKSMQDIEMLESVRVAVEVLEQTRELAALIPEIGMNIAYARPHASTSEEAVGVPGRIRPIGGRPHASNQPDFGGSDHVARAVIALMRFDRSLRSAINLRFDPELVAVCRDLGLVVSFFDRSVEPVETKKVDRRTISWGVEQAVKRAARAPDVIYDLGEEGKEPMIFLFSVTPLDVAQLASRVAREYGRRKHASANERKA